VADFNSSNQSQHDSHTSARTSSSSGDWSSERDWWRDNYSSRPYASADRGFDQYEPGYRYGYESASRYRGRNWNDVEPDLRSGWNNYEHRGANKSTWEEIKDSVKDAWDHVTGGDHDRHSSTARR
jgi:hypothetical protein